MIVSPGIGEYARAWSPGAMPKLASLNSEPRLSFVTPGVADSSRAYMSRWSSLCAGRAPVARNAASSTRFERPFVPGGRTSRKPPKSFVR